MQFYKRDPAKAIEGMQGLTLEQVGAYNLLLDHLYCRDGVLPNDDELIRAMLDVDPRVWRRLKTELMAAGKIRVTADGLINANGVTSTLLRFKVASRSGQHAANVRWNNHKNANEINKAVIPPRNATKIQSKNYSSTSSNAGASPPEKSTTTSDAAASVVVARNGSSSGDGISATQSLEASLRKKGWI